MRKHIRKAQVCRAAGVAALALCTATATSFAQPGTVDSPAHVDDNDQVRILYRRGVTLFEAGKLQEARRTLLEAWALRHTYDIASSLAQVEMELKLYAEAAAHLDFCVKNIPPAESEATLKQFREAFAATKTHVVQVSIITDRDGAEVRIDGQVVGKTPLSGPLYVEPGPHQVEAQLNDAIGRASFEVAAGKTHEVTISLQPTQRTETLGNTASTGTSRVPPSTIPSTHANDTPQRSIVPVIIGGAVFAVGLGAAIGFGLAAHSNEKDAQRLAAKHGDYGCSAGSSPADECSAQLDALRSQDRDSHWSTAGIIVAGVAAVAVPVYWFWPRSNTTGSASTVHVVTGTDSRSSWISLAGTF